MQFKQGGRLSFFWGQFAPVDLVGRAELVDFDLGGSCFWVQRRGNHPLWDGFGNSGSTVCLTASTTRRRHPNVRPISYMSVSVFIVGMWFCCWVASRVKRGIHQSNPPILDWSSKLTMNVLDLGAPYFRLWNDRKICEYWNWLPFPCFSTIVLFKHQGSSWCLAPGPDHG